VSDPEGYLKFSKGYAVYYFQLHRGSERESHKVVGFGSRMCAAIHLEPSEALNLLKWLEQEREELERLAMLQGIPIMGEYNAETETVAFPDDPNRQPRRIKVTLSNGDAFEGILHYAGSVKEQGQ